MRKKKLILNKETVKNLTLTNEELGGVVGGGYTSTTGFCPNTGSTCYSCGGSCLITVCGCGITETYTPKINPTFIPG
jgi:hypothetical protein